MSSDKPHLRKHSRHRLQSISASERQKLSKQIENHLCDFMKNQSGYWAAFRPLPEEVQINWEHIAQDASGAAAASEQVTGQPVKWVFPKLISQTEMRFLYPRQGRYVRSAWGVDEPEESSSDIVVASEISGFIVPGLLFSLAGVRLGRGQGYYDRYLQNFAGPKVGVCFSTQLHPRLPQEEHDARMTHIVSENGVVIC